MAKELHKFRYRVDESDVHAVFSEVDRVKAMVVAKYADWSPDKQLELSLKITDLLIRHHRDERHHRFQTRRTLVQLIHWIGPLALALAAILTSK